MPKVTLYDLIKAGRIRVNKQSPAEHRLWHRVNKDGPLHPTLGTKCWEWEGGLNTQGYGQIWVGGRITLVHRFSCALHGNDPSGSMVLHRCDNPVCVNPEHLFLGTHDDNMKDMAAKGRAASGEKSGPRLHPETMKRIGETNGSARFTEEQVLEIRQQHQKGSSVNGASALARKFGVTKRTILLIVTGRTWKHVGTDKDESDSRHRLLFE